MIMCVFICVTNNKIFYSHGGISAQNLWYSDEILRLLQLVSVLWSWISPLEMILPFSLEPLAIQNILIKKKSSFQSSWQGEMLKFLDGAWKKKVYIRSKWINFRNFSFSSKSLESFFLHLMVLSVFASWCIFCSVLSLSLSRNLFLTSISDKKCSTKKVLSPY